MEYVYFIGPKGADGPLKIGITTTSIRQRLMMLQIGCPFELHCHDYIDTLSDAARIETVLHRVLAGRRIRGEWFNLRPDEIVDVAKMALYIVDPDAAVRVYDGPIP